MTKQYVEQIRMLARIYLDAQQLRIAAQLRANKLEKDTMAKLGLDKEAFKKVVEEGALEEVAVLKVLNDYVEDLKREEKRQLGKAWTVFERHPIWEFCNRVRGLGPVAALTFLGFIDPYAVSNAIVVETGLAKRNTSVQQMRAARAKVDAVLYYIYDLKMSPADAAIKSGVTDAQAERIRLAVENQNVGDIYAYLGLVPGARLTSGERAGFHPHAKGRFMGVIAPNVIRQTDPYYYPIYLKRKAYLEQRCDGPGIPFGRIIKEGPKACPEYQSCIARMRGRAERLGKEEKKPACKGHLDMNARFTLTKILLEHAWRIIREAEGLPVPKPYPIVWLGHNTYIPAKPLGGDKAPPL